MDNGDAVLNWQTTIRLIGISLGSGDDLTLETLNPNDLSDKTEHIARAN